MKQFLKGVMRWKTEVCLIYTACMAIQLFICLECQVQTLSVNLLWSLLLACAVVALIQVVCFSNWVIKKMRAVWRSLLFVLLALPALAFVAWKTEWFPVENTGSWLIFLGIFFLMFVVSTIGYEIYFQITGRKYSGLIGQYRKQKEEDEK